jgi:hypothetical protein
MRSGLWCGRGEGLRDGAAVEAGRDRGLTFGLRVWLDVVRRRIAKDAMPSEPEVWLGVMMYRAASPATGKPERIRAGS